MESRGCHSLNAFRLDGELELAFLLSPASSMFQARTEAERRVLHLVFSCFPLYVVVVSSPVGKIAAVDRLAITFCCRRYYYSHSSDIH